MKPLRKRLEEARKGIGITWEIIERDYVISWVLAGISDNEKLQNGLIFKGGTALKKCYFGKYRFSEDLDFTAKASAPRRDKLEKEIERSCELASELVQKFSPLEIIAERYTEKEPHPANQEAFTIRAKLPWHRQFLVKILIEISVDEPIKIDPIKRQIIHGYGEKIVQEIYVYSLEEIIAEKMRAILQHRQKLEERGWDRSRARDYYDLWKILNNYFDQIKIEILPELFLDKCSIKEIAFDGPDEFFNQTLLDHTSKNWEHWLETLVPELPAFEQVVADLRKNLFDIFKNMK